MFDDTHWLTLTRRSLGEALLKEGEHDIAMAQLVMCLESLQQTKDDHWEGQVLHSMGLVHLARQDITEAMALFDKALEKFRESRDTLWEGRTQVSIGRAAAAADRTASEVQAAYHAAWPLLVEQGAKADLERLEALMEGGPDEPEAAGPGADRA
jgi:tetratricopeptide (TPR) repeat protein